MTHSARAEAGLRGLAITRIANSGQITSQSSGNISLRLTNPPVALSIGAPYRLGIGLEPSAHLLMSGA
jgi:hypothetical protein